eukprot:gnl/TRDRNA2_/TRDRNA2_128830_c1_seq1.p1 gnl/TRDRNA2_/TRDRNA2_128830_c1~~gnl/TRDRNA2_/TRDRNA2_128830_c1_seq1.p1  ORF type:complete len:528 (-),score=106.26 gnl/TRDRNA2_/TRDRNA2_128830_c1_seq1:291-1853(-)
MGSSSSCCGEGPAKLLAEKPATAKKPENTKKKEKQREGKLNSEVFMSDTAAAIHLLPNNKGHSPVDYYDIDEEALGEGAFGMVRRATSKKSGHKCVVKTILKSAVPHVQLFRQEILFHSEMDSPNIVRLYESFEDGSQVYIVMEACTGGELNDAMLAEGPFCEATCWTLTRQMLCAVNYMHNKGFVHRDIKPENFLLQESGVPLHSNTIKLIDFGMAQRFGPDRALTTKCGTVLFMAPEIYLREEYDEKVDVWSVGVILYILVSGKPPFISEKEEEIKMLTIMSKPKFEEKGWEAVSSFATELIQDMLRSVPEERISAADALSSPWAKDQEDNSEEHRVLRSESASNVMDNLGRVARMNSFKKSALAVVARRSDDTEIHELREIFTKLDRDGDGALTLQEMREGCEAAGLPVEGIEAMFDKMQVGEANERITYTEFLTAGLNAKTAFQEQACWEAFRVFDRDASGKISKTELRYMLESDSLLQTAKLDAATIDAIAEEADIDGDGEIEFAEFMTMLRSHS